MARIQTVKKRRVGKKGAYPLNCQKCGKPIEIGDPYKFFKMKQSRGGIKKSYHIGCEIPPSHRTTSALGAIWDAQAALDFSSCESADDCLSVLADLSNTVREVGEEYREKAENIESGFGHETEMSAELSERADQLEQWADDLDSWSPDADEPEGDDEDEREEYLDAIRDEAQQAADECPV